MRYTTSVFLTALFIGFLFSLNAQDRDISYMSSGGHLKPLQAIMDIRHYTVALDVDIPNKSISGYTEIDLVLSQPTDTILLDLAHLYTIKNVWVNKQSQKFNQDSDLIYLTNSEGFKAGKQKIKVAYSGVPPVAVNPPWKGGFSWKEDSKGNPWVIINCQMEGAKVYFPCKDHPSDEPNEGADLIITAPKDLTVAGPGLLQSSHTKKDKKTWHWKTNYTISNYCILFNIGKYALVSKPYTTINGNKVPIDFYILEEDKANGEKILEMRERDTRILEKYFGEYPWAKEKIGIAQTPNYGMEHQTMITYGDWETRFVYEKIGKEDYSANLFHEYTHEWFANKVSNKDWAHMWIQEGITTYGEALFCREAAGERGYDSMMVMIKNGIRNKKPVVQAAEVNTVDTYTGDLYTKGAFFMHMLRSVLGDNIFFPTLKKLATDSNYTYSHFVTTDDVEQLFSKESGQDLKPLFDLYLKTITLLEINVRQTGYNEYTVQVPNLPIPLPMDIVTSAGTQHVTVKDKTFKLSSSTAPVIDAKGNYLKHITTD
jgi:aminopeptidase N